MRGTLYGVGVGPGDPELLTQKAVRILREAAVIACPGGKGGPGLAFEIAAQAVPEIREKPLLTLDFPMRAEAQAAHAEAAEVIKGLLWEGRDVAFLTLGDPAVYSTFAYVLPLVRDDGFAVEIVPRVPSFSAAAAALLLPLALGGEDVHILPAGECDLSLPGTLVLMKPGRDLRALKAALKASGRDAWLTVRCGMPEEAVYHGVDSMPDEVPYFSLIIVK